MHANHDRYKGILDWMQPLTQATPITRFEVASRAFVTNRNTCLLVYEEHLDTWFTPGGRLQPPEELHSACLREMHEETGIEIVLRELVATWSVLIPRTDHAVNKFEFMFLATPRLAPDFIEREQVDLDVVDGVSKIRWFSDQELASLPNVFPPFLKSPAELKRIRAALTSKLSD